MPELTDDASAGPEGAGPGAGSAGAGDGGAANPPAGGGDAPWYESLGLDDEAKAFLAKTGYTDARSAVKSFIAAEKKLGIPPDRLLRLPEGSPAQNPEDFAEIFKALGLPDDAKGYDLHGVDGVFDFTDDAEKAAVAEGLHKAGILPHQAQAILETVYAPLMQAQMERTDAQIREAYEKGEAALKAEWGAKYEDNLNLASAVAAKLPEDFRERLAASGLNNDPVMIKLLAELGEAKTESQGLPGRQDGGSAGRRTPAEVEAALAEFDRKWGDAFNDRSHPNHAAAVQMHKDIIASGIG